MKQISVRLIFCLIMVFVFTALNAYAYVSPSGSGISDLSYWNPGSGCIPLDGDWKLYWSRLLSYEDTQAAEIDKIVTVPASWTEYVLYNSRLPSEGFATYSLHVKTNLKPGTLLGLYINSMPMAYRVYINGVLAGSSGTVSNNAEGTLVNAWPQAVYFTLPDSEFDIIIQASNYQTLMSGMIAPLYLGSGGEVYAMYNKTVFKSSILYGALFIVMAFLIMTAILCRDINYSLFLALMCISIYFALDLTGINVTSRLIPRLDISNARALLYSSIVWGVLSVTLYWYFQFKSAFYKFVLKLVICLSVCWQLSVIFVPIKNIEAFIYLSPKINLIVVYAVITGLFNIVGIIKGTRDNFIVGMEQLLCVSIFTVSALLDFSYYKGDSRLLSFPVLYYALLIILAVQMTMLAKQVRGLLEQQRNDELRFVQAQIKPYLLYSVINTYITTSQQDNDKARTILESFASYLRKTFDIKKSYRYYSLKEAISLVQSYISIEQIRLDNALEVNYELPENLDVAIPTCMLQPIVENSIVHGLRFKERGGRIDIKIKQRGRHLYFSVKDNGVGMSPKEISNALGSTRSNSLSNISDRLSLFNRKVLSISSSPNEGTEVNWRVRIKELKDLC